VSRTETLSSGEIDHYEGYLIVEVNLTFLFFKNNIFIGLLMS